MSLKSQADYLITEHPDLAPQIQAGLILAVAGRVTPMGDPIQGLTRNWQVLGTTYKEAQCKIYTVRDLATTPRRWDCNCHRARLYGPLTADFLGHPGRICKHIAAVGICWLECLHPEKPANLFDLFSRLVQEQAIYLGAGEAIELPTPHKVKLEYYTQNGRDGLVLKTGKVRTDVLARWLPVEGQAAGGEWRLVEGAQVKYRVFVDKVNGGSNAKTE